MQTRATIKVDPEISNFLTLINNYRRQNGAGPLSISVALTNAAQWKSTDMANNNYFGHNDQNGRTFSARLAAFGYNYQTLHAAVGENIAAGPPGAQAEFDGWRTACDPDETGRCTYAHNVNMLNPIFKAIGIARAYNANSTYKWYWTTDFGSYVQPS